MDPQATSPQPITASGWVGIAAGVLNVILFVGTVYLNRRYDIRIANLERTVGQLEKENRRLRRLRKRLVRRVKALEQQERVWAVEMADLKHEAEVATVVAENADKFRRYENHQLRKVVQKLGFQLGLPQNQIAALCNILPEDRENVDPAILPEHLRPQPLPERPAAVVREAEITAAPDRGQEPPAPGSGDSGRPT